MSNLRKTPLAPMHSHARLTEFAGWEMPVYYTGILDEHMAVRERCGIFDVSHMAKILVSGPEALGFLQLCLTNNIARLDAGQAAYTLMCNPEGGIIDDLIVYHLPDGDYLVVANAVNEQSVYYWLEGHLPSAGVSLANLTEDYALIALQGPEAMTIIDSMLDADPLSLKYFNLCDALLSGLPVRLARTGYTGEDGCEIFLNRAIWPQERLEGLWRDLLEKGVCPCGLGSRDTLRLEAGYPLYGHELTDTTNPLQAGLGWAVKFNKGDFIGRVALEREKQTGSVEILAGFRMLERSVPRQGYPVFNGDDPVGLVTSGSYSPVRREDIGMAYLLEPFASAGIRLEILVRQRRLPIEVIPRPFVQTRAGKTVD